MVEFSVYGSIIDSSVYQLRSIDSGVLDRGQSRSLSLGKIQYNKVQVFFNLLNDITFTMPLEELSKGRILKVPIKNDNYLHEITVIIIDTSNLYLRINSIDDYPLGKMNKKSIAIVGLGSGGSLIGLYLAKSGIGKLILIDGDILQEHNIIRHICSLYDVGRYKTLAVKDYILRRIPNVQLNTIEKEFSINDKYEEDFYKNVLSGVDLIVSATGDHIMNKRINAFAYKMSKPVIYAGAFEKIVGGIMIRVDPNKGSTCYDCIYKTNPDLEHPAVTDKTIFYGRDVNEMLTQPGLGLDIDLITLPTVKFILSTLLEIEGFEAPLPSNIYYWFNRDLVDSEIESFALYHESRTLNKRPDCNICSSSSQESD